MYEPLGNLLNRQHLKLKLLLIFLQVIFDVNLKKINNTPTTL